MRISVSYPKTALMCALSGIILIAGTGCPKVGPKAAFSVSATIGYAPAAIQFTDTSDPGSSTITSWAWDFDNDGSVDSTEQHPSYTFATAGVYNRHVEGDHERRNQQVGRGSLHHGECRHWGLPLRSPQLPPVALRH